MSFAQKALAVLMAIVLAVGLTPMLPMAQSAAYAADDDQTTEETTAAVPVPFEYEGEFPSFIDADGKAFGMYAAQEGTTAVLDGDNVVITYKPKNKTVYSGFYLNANAKDKTTWDENAFFEAVDGGATINITLPSTYCGHAWPVAPKKASDGESTASQYYLAVPPKDVIPAAQGETANTVDDTASTPVTDDSDRADSNPASAADALIANDQAATGAPAQEQAATTETGLAIGKETTVGTGAQAADVKATSDTAVTYVASASKSTKKVTVPDTVAVGGKTYKVTKVASNAFKGSKATSVKIGKNVTSIAKKAFAGASKLTKVTITSKNLKSKKAIANAFKGSKVKTVTLKGMTAKQKKAVKAAILKYGGKKGVKVK